MKKIICAVIALMILIIPSFCVSAESTESTLFGVSNSVSGSSYKVTLKISTDYLCAGVQAVVKYDSTVISCVDANSKEVNISDGKIMISKVADNNDGDNWVTLNFTSKRPAFAKDFAISNVKSVKIANEKALASENYKKFTCGDLNSDNSIDIIDLVRLKKSLSGVIDLSNECDYNLDGKYNSTDLVGLRAYLLSVL